MWSNASPRTFGMFCAMSMSKRPSPSRSPNLTLRPAPHFGVSNFFHSFGCGLAARSEDNSFSHAATRLRIRCATASGAETTKSVKRGDVRGNTRAASEDVGVARLDDQLAVEVGPHLRPVVFDLQLVVLLDVIIYAGGP